MDSNMNDMNNFLNNYLKSIQTAQASYYPLAPSFGISNPIPPSFNMPYTNASPLVKEEPAKNNSQGIESQTSESNNLCKKYNPDWICPKKGCRNRNFAKRTKCNLCGMQKPSNPELDYTTFPANKYLN
jgi:hypothetical protein